MTHPVPLLDLAPKRKTPLSLWNPFDYLVLLYWVFFFPQALRWYVDKFGTVKYKRENRNLRVFLQLLRDDAVQRNLLVQGLLLIPLTAITFSLLLQQAGIPIYWFGIAFGIILGMAAGVVGSMTSNVTFGVAYGVAGGAAVSLAGGVMFGVTVGMKFNVIADIARKVTSGVALGVTLGVALGIVGGMTGSVSFGSITTGGVAFGVPFGLALYVMFGMMFGVLCITLGVPFGIAFGMADSVVSAAIILRLLDFVLAWMPTLLFERDAWQLYRLPSRVTLLPLPNLRKWICARLQADISVGLHDMDQLQRYSMQFIPVVDAINDWLATLQEKQMFSSVDALATAPYDWDIVRFGSASLNNAMLQASLDIFFFLPKVWQKKIRQPWNVSPRLDSLARATCAGYWLLHKKDTTAALEAFAHTRHILHGETLYQITRALELGRKVDSLQNIVIWEDETNWLEQPNENLLRPQAILTLRRLRQAAREAGVATASISQLNRSAALGRALAKLTELLDDLDQTCSELERPIVREIAEKWRNILAREAGQAGQIVITKSIENPFVVGNPVSGTVFVGREEILRRIEEWWGNSSAQSVPSLVIFGHRRMGKSSILQNLGERRFGVNTIVAQFTMQRAGRLQNTGELLGIFASCMHEALSAKGINVPEPDFAIFERSPYPSFNSFLAAVKRHVTGQRVILTIDEFELIEDAIQKKSVDAELLSYLRGVIHSEPWFVLALAGLHTLEEMTADYWNPLFSSVTPVRVSFLSWEATANLLANPTDDFPLDFTREAIDCVYAHVKGQPFLTQLIGHTLVRLYNQSVFENQNPREPRFSATDVDEVVGRPEFYEQGHYYFQGVWSQAQSGPQGQLTLLRALAQADGALPLEEWRSATGLDASIAEAAVKTLLQHDVVWLTPEGEYDFAVPLMRRWLRK